MRSRAQTAGIVAALALVVLFVIGGIWAAALDGYVLKSFAGVDSPSQSDRRAGSFIRWVR